MILPLPNTGVYRVGKQIFQRKTLALLEATSTKSTIQWDFHDHVFSQVPWQLPPTESLKELYKRRAQQLRDKYDWLVLNFSGGCDSWGVLNSFISNNIHLDEVFVRWPKKGLEGTYTPNNVDKSPFNLHSEWDYAIKPELDKLEKYHPEIKITIHDWTDELAEEVAEDSFGMTSHYLNLGAFKKFGATADTEVTLRDKEKRVGVIFGIDKPKCIRVENDFYVYFADHLVSGCQPDGEYNRNIELFYWTPDMPDIVRAQGHLMFNFFRANPAAQFVVTADERQSQNDRGLMDQIVKDICQPDYDKSKFQAGKPTSQIYTENDHWLRSKFGTERFMSAWRYGLTQYFKLIDKRFFVKKNDRIDGYRAYTSPYYKIGTFNASETPANVDFSKAGVSTTGTPT